MKTEGGITMQELDVRVRAESDDLGRTWVLECNKCGLLGVAGDADVDPFAADHLTASHGALAVTS